MVEQKHGAMSWSDISIVTSGSGGKDQWLKLKKGSNKVRILTDPYQYYQHRYSISGEKGFGHRVNCSIKNGFCPVCEKDNKPKKRWYLGVIDRSTESYKILDVSWAVLMYVQQYANDPDWGDSKGYDFDIIVNPNAAPNEYYKCVAKPKTPLSAADLMILENDVNLAALDKLCAPPEPKKVEERLKYLMDEFIKKGGDTTPVVDSKLTSPVNFDSSEDSDFPAADATSVGF